MSRRKWSGRGSLRREETGDFLTGPRRGEFERLVDVDIALRHASGGVAQQGGDRQFGKSEVAGDAAECMAQRVGGDSLDLRGGAKRARQPLAAV